MPDAPAPPPAERRWLTNPPTYELDSPVSLAWKLEALAQRATVTERDATIAKLTSERDLARQEAATAWRKLNGSADAALDGAVDLIHDHAAKAATIAKLTELAGEMAAMRIDPTNPEAAIGQQRDFYVRLAEITGGDNG